MARTPAGTEPRYGELVSQYLRLREEHPGVLLLCRVGSFYEVLFEDAELVARELGLKLSDRPSGGSGPAVPQCGFAHHALDGFLRRLLARGYRVAVVEEDEDTDGSGVRHRAVVRTLTPGTVTEPALLADDRPTYLVAMVAENGRFGLAWTDVAAGEFKAGEFDTEAAAAELQRLAPAEVLLPVDTQLPKPWMACGAITRVESTEGVREVLRRTFPDGALGDLPLAELAAGLVVRYLAMTAARGQLPPVDAPVRSASTETLQMDAATQRHLELVETERSRDRVGSLLHSLDRCATPMGRRMLRSWLLRPLRDTTRISVRQMIVSELVADEHLRQALVQLLERTPDLERLAGRAAAGTASTDDLHALAGLHGLLTQARDNVGTARTGFLRSLGRERSALAAFAMEAARVLADVETPHTIRRGASPVLDQALAQIEDAEAWQSRYLKRLRQQADLEKVKIERNNTQGLFLEVPVNTVVPADWTRRGGLQKVERYTTAELEQHAACLAEAEAVVAAETRVLLAGLRDMAAACAGEARDLGRHLAAADALYSLAIVAIERGWVCPTVEATTELEIRAGRHPVLEAAESFQPNDTHLVGRGERDQLVVLTGPNMAGKSTWMRQVALIVVLAQAGSFVPARAARIGMADAIFTRIGAVDDLAHGRSTFMVEMLETAVVLRGATDHSLVLLDEIGRGTSTHDGMAIAWAVIEHLACGPARPRAVLSTHYHELAVLGERCGHITLLQATVAEGTDGLSFPHRIVPGAADRSFGIEVARLAGLPDEVVRRARQVADAIEPMTRDLAARLEAPTFTRQP
jgi:DNA mismatch repair protein MutS